nr:AEC family transporter [uncultured Lachnoclostridium sp.]
MFEIIKNTLTDDALLGAIFSSVSIIMLGFFLRRKEILNGQAGKILSKIVLTIGLPALAFTSFMKDLDHDQLRQGMNILIWGFALYILLIPITKLLYVKVKGDKQDVYRVLTIFGSTTFFGTPIVQAVYGATGAMYASIFNIPYRVFLYSYAYVKMSGVKMDKENMKKNAKEVFLNPIILATFAGLLIWIFQESLPQVMIATEAGEKSVAFLRIDQTLPWFYKALDYLKSLASPLAWLSIGATLAEVPFKKAVVQKDAWAYSLSKVLLIPAINIAILVVLSTTGILPVAFEAVATTVIMMATPTATVAAAYAISFDREAVFTSNCSLLSTVAAVIATPVWLIILEIVKNINLFA